MTAPTISSKYIQQPAKRRDSTTGCRIQFAVVLLVTLILELILLLATARDILSIGWAALLHVLLVALLLFWQQKIFRCPGGVKRRTTYLFLVATAAFGPIGVLGTLFTIALHTWYQRSTTSFEDWYAGLFPKEQRDEVAELADFLDAHSRLNGANVPDSFHDILSNGTLQQKRDAIVLMSKHFRPEFAQALRSALLDPDNSIRVMAASSISRIENRFLEKAMQVDRAAAKAPDDVDILLRQAKLYDDYAFTGLLERDREEANREKAKQIYREIIKLQPENYPATLGLGRLLIRTGEVEEAAERLQQTLQFRNGEPQLMLWYAECLYKLGHYQELRKLLREQGAAFIDGPGKQRPRIADAVQMWLGRGASAN